MSLFAGAASASPFEGIWKYEQRSLIAKAVLYSALEPGGTCSQVARGRALGMTHWVVNTCEWSVVDGVLRINILESTQEDAVGTTSKYSVLESSAKRLELSISDEQHTWMRVTELPPKFADRVTESLAAPLDQ
ncbi:hypothetical protein GYB61_08895 [bacterium]|nr:hypothetical protein [bacterium]